MPTWTCALSGPERSRAKAEVALEAAGLPILPDRHHAVMDWRSKFPEEKDEWLTVIAEHPDQAVGAVEKAKGWRLRVHYPVPSKPEPSPEQALVATIAEMRAEIDALKARVG